MKKLLFLFFSPLFCLAMTDAEYEKRLHNIYLKYYKNPISYADWNHQIQKLAKKYQLKHKDNMWDLSDNFFKNPLYWSKLWMINSQVENPHRIYKGDFLKLDLASLSQVTKSKQGADLEALFPNIKIPASSSKPALKEDEFPSSLPQLDVLAQFNQVQSEIDFSKLDFFLPATQAPAPFYLSDSVPSKQGTIIGQTGYGKSFGVTGEILVIRLDQSAPKGTYFTVFKNRGRPTGILPGFIRRNEYEIQVKGILKIVSYIQGSGQLYKAQVISTLDSLNKKDSIFKGLPPSYSFSVKKRGTGQGRIIGSPYKDRLFLTAGSVVYLDQGTADGVYASDSFYIQATKTAEKSKFFKRPSHQELSDLGMLTVVTATRNRSTAIIIRAKDSIYIGDVWTGALKAIEVEGIEDWEDRNQGDNLLLDLEVDPDYKEDFPERPEDEELQNQFESSEDENPFPDDFEIEIQDSSKEIHLEEEERDQELEEEFQFHDEEGDLNFEDLEEIEEEEPIEEMEEEDPSSDLKDFEEIDIH